MYTKILNKDNNTRCEKCNSEFTRPHDSYTHDEILQIMNAGSRKGHQTVNARSMGVCYRQYSNWLNGRVEPKITTFSKLIEGLGGCVLVVDRKGEARYLVGGEL